MVRVRKLREEETGSVTAAVLVFPFALVLMFGIIQVGLAGFAKVIVTGAAQDAARAAQISGGDTSAGADAGTRTAAFAGMLRNLSVDVDASTDTVTAEVSGDVTLLFDIPLRVEGRAAGPIERFRPERP